MPSGYKKETVSFEEKYYDLWKSLLDDKNLFIVKKNPYSF